MNQIGIKLTVIWEEIVTPDAPQRLAAAFAMLLSPAPPSELLSGEGLDSND